MLVIQFSVLGHRAAAGRQHEGRELRTAVAVPGDRILGANRARRNRNLFRPAGKHWML